MLLLLQLIVMQGPRREHTLIIIIVIVIVGYKRRVRAWNRGIETEQGENGWAYSMWVKRMKRSFVVVKVLIDATIS